MPPRALPPALAALLLAAAAGGARAHGSMVWPPSSRNAGSYGAGASASQEGAGAVDALHAALLARGEPMAGAPATPVAPARPRGHPHGDIACAGGACLWFSQPMHIPGEATLPARARTVNVKNGGGGPLDWSAAMPWRAPGAAPVLGSGCGVAGGSSVEGLMNGGNPPGLVPQGADGALLPPRWPATWTAGADEEVAWGITANHGGGYSYRLCGPLADPADPSEVSEACFQRRPLPFANTGGVQWLQGGLDPSNRTAIPRVTVSEGTTPEGSEWARNPIPGCAVCNPAGPCGLAEHGELPPEPGTGNAWINQTLCNAFCDGLDPSFDPRTGAQRRRKSCPGPTQFPEPVPGMSGFLADEAIDDTVIVDKVHVPAQTPEGRYLLGFRWDCEQSSQIWQTCADVLVVSAASSDEEAGGDASAATAAATVATS